MSTLIKVGVLGTLHPERVAQLVRYRTWADSKRWLFQYTPEETACAEEQPP